MKQPLPFLKNYKASCLLYLILCCTLYSVLSYAQGVGNHITMSLENCSYPAANIIQFDLFIVSDGASNSKLRLNSTQWGINYDCCILQNGATANLAYVPGTSDIIPPFNGFA